MEEARPMDVNEGGASTAGPVEGASSAGQHGADSQQGPRPEQPDNLFAQAAEMIDNDSVDLGGGEEDEAMGDGEEPGDEAAGEEEPERSEDGRGARTSNRPPEGDKLWVGAITYLDGDGVPVSIPKQHSRANTTKSLGDMGFTAAKRATGLEMDAGASETGSSRLHLSMLCTRKMNTVAIYGADDCCSCAKESWREWCHAEAGESLWGQASLLKGPRGRVDLLCASRRSNRTGVGASAETPLACLQTPQRYEGEDVRLSHGQDKAVREGKEGPVGHEAHLGLPLPGIRQGCDGPVQLAANLLQAARFGAGRNSRGSTSGGERRVGHLAEYVGRGAPAAASR
jgi:hypothetical protein